jgi:hypothetical protein
MANEPQPTTENFSAEQTQAIDYVTRLSAGFSNPFGPRPGDDYANLPSNARPVVTPPDASQPKAPTPEELARDIPLPAAEK